MNEKKALPSIIVLLKESWSEFTKSLLNLFLLFLLAIPAYIVAGLAVLLIFFIFGLSAFLSNPASGLESLMTNPVAILGIILGIIVAIVLMTFIGLIFQIATIRLVYNPEKKQSLLELVKTSKNYIIPLFVVSFLSGILSLGGFGLLIIPGIIFSLLFSFSGYEVLFNKQRGLNALRRSYALFSTNFWGIIGRLLLFVVISMLVTIVIPKDDSMGALAGLINIILSWFGLCYSVTLYKQVAKGNEHLPGKSLRGIVITAIIGIILSVVVGLSVMSLAISTIIPQLQMMNEAKKQQNNMYAPSYPDQMNDTMPTEQQMQEMMKQLPENESMMFENQAI